MSVQVSVELELVPKIWIMIRTKEPSKLPPFDGLNVEIRDTTFNDLSIIRLIGFMSDEDLWKRITQLKSIDGVKDIVIRFE